MKFFPLGNVPSSSYASSAPPPGITIDYGQQHDPSSIAPYLQQPSGPYPTTAAAAYPAKDDVPLGPPPDAPAQDGPLGYDAQGPSPGYPAQGPSTDDPAQGPPPGYSAQDPSPGYPALGAFSGYPAQGAVPGYFQQGVPLPRIYDPESGVCISMHYDPTTNQPRIITQV